MSKDVTPERTQATTAKKEAAMLAAEGWIDESFACKSVEIINTKTIVSRNNTRFEVHQYKRDDTTYKEE